jgi:hypothetical protein
MGTEVLNTKLRSGFKGPSVERELKTANLRLTVLGASKFQVMHVDNVWAYQ